MKVKAKAKLLSRVRLLATAWTAAYQAPLSMGFSRQKYWSGVPLPSPFIAICVSILISYQSVSLLIDSNREMESNRDWVAALTARS